MYSSISHHPSIHPSVHPSVHPPIHPFVSACLLPLHFPALYPKPVSEAHTMCRHRIRCQQMFMHGYKAQQVEEGALGCIPESAFSSIWPQFPSSGVLHCEDANTDDLPEWLEVERVLNIGAPVSTLESSRAASS